MQLHFRNVYGYPLSVAIMFYSPETCAEYGQWGTRGWWNIYPNGQTHVLNTNNRYAYFYAEATDGATWSGQPGSPVMYVTQAAFDSCYLIGSTAARTVRVRRLDLGTGAGIIQPLG
ncbi:DUF1036 domain-containing protein [Spongiactinospora sp. 9N601]|uniref:DUF1036 domain-containing protein n=1 Tax=Spongiactinospora sp. 9N601 TaxID=3375149 RepID=UPI0037A979D6